MPKQLIRFSEQEILTMVGDIVKDQYKTGDKKIAISIKISPGLPSRDPRESSDPRVQYIEVEIQ